MHRRLIICLLVFAVVLISHSTWAEDQKTGPRPGAENPMKDNKGALFRDDELFFIFGDPPAHSMKYLDTAPEDNLLDYWTTRQVTVDFDETQFSDLPFEEYVTPPVASATGRFTPP